MSSYNWRTYWNQIAKRLDITIEHAELDKIGRKFELLENLLDQSSSLITNIKASGKDVFISKQSKNKLHKILFHIYMSEKEIRNFFYPYLDRKMGIKNK